MEVPKEALESILGIPPPCKTCVHDNEGYCQQSFDGRSNICEEWIEWFGAQWKVVRALHQNTKREHENDEK